VLAADIVQAPTFRPSLKDGALVVVNSPTTLAVLDGLRVACVDATGIALEFGLGSKAQPVVNTAILGAFAKVSGDLKLDNLLSAVADKVPMKTEQNVQAVKKAYEMVSCVE